MIFIIPLRDWSYCLCEAVMTAKPGDTIRVDEDYKADIAKRAIEGLGRPGILVEVRRRSEADCMRPKTTQ